MRQYFSGSNSFLKFISEFKMVINCFLREMTGEQAAQEDKAGCNAQPKCLVLAMCQQRDDCWNEKKTDCTKLHITNLPIPRSSACRQANRKDSNDKNDVQILDGDDNQQANAPIKNCQKKRDGIWDFPLEQLFACWLMLFKI